MEDVYNKNQTLDAFAIQQQSKQSALDSLKAHNYSEKIDKHISSLIIQGKSFTEIQKYVHLKAILKWDSFLETVPDHLFKFARKALQQQLPTASNLFRWKKNNIALLPVVWAGAKRTNTSYQIVVHLQAYPDTLEDTTMFLEY